MLQLPTPTPRRARFSSAEIAEMSRGAKVRVKAKPKKDPIIAMVARADRLLDEYTSAVNDAYFAKIKLPSGDQGYPAVGITDDMVNLHWSRGFLFTSERHIDECFRKALAQARQRLADAERGLKNHRRGHSIVSRLEFEQRIASEKRCITKLREFRAPMKAAFREEVARLLKVQNRVGLVVARKKVRLLFAALRRQTIQIARSRPTTIDGALSTARYVERRLWCDKQQIFSEQGSLPGNFGQLMRASLVLINEHLPS